VSRCQKILQAEGHCTAGWSVGGSVELQTAGPTFESPFVRAMGGRKLRCAT